MGTRTSNTTITESTTMTRGGGVSDDQTNNKFTYFPNTRRVIDWITDYWTQEPEDKDWKNKTRGKKCDHGICITIGCGMTCCVTTPLLVLDCAVMPIRYAIHTYNHYTATAIVNATIINPGLQLESTDSQLDV